MTMLDDPRQVAEQYRTPANFDARVRLYERFANGPARWLERAFDHIGLREGERVLDIGCGTGNIWRDNRDRLPRGVDLLLADASQGMLDEAAARLAASGIGARFEVADVQHMPFESHAFDVVIANHMLYHVGDRTAALAELARVVRASGRCVVSTNDWTHLIELRELTDRFGIPTALRRVGREAGFFDAEQAAAELSEAFAAVSATRFHDSLDVTDSEALVAYVRSMTRSAEVDESRFERLRAHADLQIERVGSVHLTTSVVGFEARRSRV